MRSAVFVMSMGLTLATVASAQDPQGVGGITAQTLRLSDDRGPVLLMGQVLSADEGRPVAGAQVYLNGTTIGDLTDAYGFVYLDVPADGSHALEVRLIGYEDERLDLELESGTVTQFLMVLRRDETVPRHDSLYLAPLVPVPPVATDTTRGL